MSTTATQCLANRETNLAAQRSDEASQQGTEAQCYVGNDASEHTAETGFSLVLLASVVHVEVELCVLTSSLRRQVERQRSTVITVKSVLTLSLQLVLCCC